LFHKINIIYFLVLKKIQENHQNFVLKLFKISFAKFLGFANYSGCRQSCVREVHNFVILIEGGGGILLVGNKTSSLLHLSKC